MNKVEDSKVVFKFLDAQLLVKRARPNPAYLIAHNTALHSGVIAKYDAIRFELKTFTFSSGSQSLSIDNAILGPIPKRILLLTIDNKGFLGSLDRNPFEFHHYDMDYFSLYVNGKQIPSGGLHLNTDKEKTSVMAYRTLFEESGIRHSNAGLQISHAMYVNGYFMVHYGLTPDHGASDGHTSHADSVNIRTELKFKKALPVATICLFYLEYDCCVRIDSRETSRQIFIMDTR